MDLKISKEKKQRESRMTGSADSFKCYPYY